MMARRRRTGMNKRARQGGDGQTAGGVRGEGAAKQAGGGRRARTRERGQNDKRGEASRAMDMASITAGKTAVRMPVKGPRPRAQRKIGGTKTKTTPTTEKKVARKSRGKQKGHAIIKHLPSPTHT